MRYDLKLTEMSTGVAAAVLDMPRRSILNYRERYGLWPLGSDGRHYRADAFSLSEMLLMQKLSPRLPGAGAAKLAQFVGPALCWHALLHVRSLDGVPKVEGFDTVAVIEQLFGERFPDGVPPYMKGIQAEHRGRQRWLAFWGDAAAYDFSSDIIMTDNLATLPDRLGREHLEEPFTIIDLMAMGGWLSRRAAPLAQLVPASETI